ncbi:MAG: phosphotransferase [Alphaproteobacteria bacterium]|nr:phosphotransferase [Alphaproteobacteria bacterium]
MIPALANDHLSSFLAAQGWLDAGYEPFPADWGTRTYARLTKADGRTALLMDMSLDSNLPDYVRIADYLRSVGLHTPEVYAVDERAGLALIEDFGDISFGNRLRRGYNDIYELATDALIQLRDRADRKALDLPVYRDTPYNLGKRRIVDWYVPAARGSKNPDGLAESFLAVWDRIESALPPCPQVICHADYHPENLMLLPGQGCGLIDFQDAFIGPAPYDLANLLEDIRNDVSEDLRAAMKKRYCADMTSQEREAFDSWYRVVATHFHCRVIGQCYKLAVGSGRDDLLTYLPRMEGYMRVALGHPVLAPLADWFVAQGIDFENTPVIMAEDLKPFIREDAY